MKYNILEFLQAVEEIPMWDRAPGIRNDNLEMAVPVCKPVLSNYKPKEVQTGGFIFG
nr:hypothetical protein [Acutalibacter muris]